MRRLGFGTWTLLAMGGAAVACGDDGPGAGPVSPVPSASSSAPPSASSAKPPAPPASSSTSTPPVPPPPVLDTSVPGTFFERVRHLVEGKDARQKGVTPGALTPRRAALVSGTVLDREGKAIPNATVRVPHDGGWGATTTLADGSWELVVQGGERVLVQIEKEGYLPSQRWASPRWNRYAVIEPVVLIPASAKTTAVTFGAAGWQTARGELSKDTSGSRTAMVLFPPGVTATATTLDGTKASLTKGTFRVTEYTVGERGPQAMPGNLPPLSGYTYASEFTKGRLFAEATTRTLGLYENVQLLASGRPPRRKFGPSARGRRPARAAGSSKWLLVGPAWVSPPPATAWPTRAIPPRCSSLRR